MQLLGETKMVTRELKITNPTGLHFRPAGLLCNEAIKFKSKIMYKYGDNEANAKSVLSVLGSGVKSGTTLLFTCEGEDEEEAMEAIAAIIESGLGE